MVNPHEEISYLVRSENRVRVLTSLASEPMTKRAVVDETGVSGVTAGRIIEGFLERGWIRQNDETYDTTEVGDLLAADYQRLFDSMDLACRLGPVIEHVPLYDMDFDIRHLIDAAVSDPETLDPLRAMDRQVQLFREADHARGFTHRFPNFVGEVIFDEVLAGDLEWEIVVEASLADRLLDSPDIRAQLAEVVRSGAEVYRASEGTHIPHHAGTFDDMVGMIAYNEAGSMVLGIETYADPIREWVHDTYEAYRADATRLKPDTLGS